MNAHAALLDQLNTRFQGLSKAEQARRIGVSQAFWWKVTCGQKRLGQRTLNKIRSAYPELAGSAIAVLLDSPATDAPQARQTGKETASEGRGGRKSPARPETRP